VFNHAFDVVDIGADSRVPSSSNAQVCHLTERELSKAAGTCTLPPDRAIYASVFLTGTLMVILALVSADAVVFFV